MFYNKNSREQINLTYTEIRVYNQRMRSLFVFCLLIISLIVSGCGVKSDLVRPDQSFPRDYPVY